MKIAFVGKGGAGKTTTSVLFAQFAAEKAKTVAIDADINMNLVSELLDDKDFIKLSDKQISQEIKQYLIGDNTRVKSPSHFRKSTPPARGSKLIDPLKQDDKFINKYLRPAAKNLAVGVIGTYSEDEIASSCYHNNLAIAENIVSHAVNNQSVICYDMVAGTDAFAGTLYAQFDLIIFVAEPTKKSVEVYKLYKKLAKNAGISGALKVVVNKVSDSDDKEFIKSEIGNDIIGFMGVSDHLKAVEKGRTRTDYRQLTPNDQSWLDSVWNELSHNFAAASDRDRLEKIWQAHKIYASQGYVVKAVGDLQNQIDEGFNYEQ